MTMFKTTTAKTPDEYIQMLEEPRRSEIKQIHEFILKTLPKQAAYIQSGMIAYGQFHYKYPSGREGDWMLVALASQKNYISIYVCATKGDKYIAEIHKDKLKANIGKSCIRFKKAAEIDFEVLKKVLLEAQQAGGVAAV